ncbi:MAG: adenylate/guanylate cyclase domain-containing protein [Actinomycetota bacterium]
MAHDHDAGAQRDRDRRRGVHGPRVLRHPAQRGARGSAGRAGTVRGAHQERPAELDRGAPEGRDGVHRRPRRVGLDPVRRRGSHAARTAPLAGRGRGHPRSLFSHFDTLVERHGLEKIKTIGDCYMAAAGVPVPCADHASRAASLALDMQAAVATSAIAGRDALELRIGINSGPVTAGVIGTKRFLYDLWGDAVNTASRMESNGTPDEIQITRATFELLKDGFVCRRRGTILVKGKGQMETWYLIRAVP